MPDCLSLIWGHSMFAKCPILRFSKSYSFNSSICSICPKLPKWWHFGIFLNTGPCGAGNFKTLLLQQFSSDPIQTYENIAYHRGVQHITLLGNQPSLTKFMVLWNLTWESMGKSKMWNISKTVEHSAKRTKLWVSGYYSAHSEGTFDARFPEFG